jgi:hypothetical protein
VRSVIPISFRAVVGGSNNIAQFKINARAIGPARCRFANCQDQKLTPMPTNPTQMFWLFWPMLACSEILRFSFMRL